MANLNGTIENKTIVFSENDLVLNTWRLQVSNASPRSLSLLINAALRHYMHTHTFSCIGKVCIKNPRAEAVKKHVVCLSLVNSPDIKTWLKESKGVGISPVVMIKSVLANSIEVVEEESQQWIPSQIEIIEMANRERGGMFQDDISIIQSMGGQSPVIQPLGQTGERKIPLVESRGLPIKKPSSLSSNNREAVPPSSPQKVNVKNDNEKKKPRAAALRGLHFK